MLLHTSARNLRKIRRWLWVPAFARGLHKSLISNYLYRWRFGGSAMTERQLGQLGFADRLVADVAGGNEFLSECRLWWTGAAWKQLLRRFARG